MPDVTRLYGLLSNMGYSPVQAAGILGNLKAESNLNPNAVGDRGTSFGLAQWHNNRWNALNNFASQNGMQASDPEAQLRYLDWELKNKERKAYGALQAAQTPRDAAAAMIHFERPQGYSPENPLAAMGASARVGNADNFYRQLAGGPAPAGGMGAQPSPATGAIYPQIPNQPDISSQGQTAQLANPQLPQQPGPDITAELAKLFGGEQQQSSQQPQQQEQPQSLGLLDNMDAATTPPAMAMGLVGAGAQGRGVLYQPIKAQRTNRRFV